MKTRIFTLVLCVTIGMCTAIADNLTYEFDNSTGELVISGTGPMERIYSGNTSVKSVIITEGVTSLPKVAFNNCSNLISISIAESVTSIGEKAFYNCKKLTEITIPKNVTSIGKEALAWCNNLNKLTWDVISYPNNKFDITKSHFSATFIDTLILGDDVVIVPENLCKDFNLLTSVSFGKNVQTVFPNCFSSCADLSIITVSVENSKFDCRENSNALIETATNTLVLGGKNTTIPNNITSIGDYAFAGRGPNYETGGYGEGLVTLNIPSSVTSIGSYAFSDCKNLVTLNIPNTITFIGEDAFANCWKLPSMVIPNGVTSIKGATFSNCYALSSIELSDNLDTIGANAFENCGNLTNITFPTTLTSIGSYAFHNCTALAGLTLPDNLSSIEPYTFHSCTSLDSITIPSQVSKIGWCAFCKCQGLKSVKFLRNEPAELEKFVFSEVGSPFTIHVPCNTGNLYRGAWEDLVGDCIEESDCGADFENIYIEKVEQHSVNKVIRDGHIFIERNDKTYTITGQEVK